MQYSCAIVHPPPVPLGYRPGALPQILPFLYPLQIVILMKLFQRFEQLTFFIFLAAEHPILDIHIRYPQEAPGQAAVFHDALADDAPCLKPPEERALRL